MKKICGYKTRKQSLNYDGSVELINCDLTDVSVAIKGSRCTVSKTNSTGTTYTLSNIRENRRRNRRNNRSKRLTASLL